ncbi:MULTISPECIES: hypothetical protein [Bacillus]|uniref:Uncharacterized protein n=1 Tax=Bacillus glycinifermentans TaxID=1664069 RepID=A0A0T6BI80_9BACI|nr:MULTISPECIES: hypothetical protein [Bacillus]KRT87076.1 hypothetical protein AB447_208905 [Bacillus glycinifermentans]MEC0341872.1 hypothetical protein [Bacillus sonorensis]MEC0457442.1 hypothetical protein [Bacillus sonorensis]MEC0487125.1 hypothetical protein [Bacillus glycinifermentans]MEC0530763.1 hypothetical protein [Bacillus sonorensis]
MKNFDNYIYEFVDVKEDGIFLKTEKLSYQELLKQQEEKKKIVRGQNSSGREELKGQPLFFDYAGPMYNGTHNGKTVIRYETRAAYDVSTQ